MESRTSGSCGEKYALFRALEVPRPPLMDSDQMCGDDVRVRLEGCRCEWRASLERHCEHRLRESKEGPGLSRGSRSIIVNKAGQWPGSSAH